MLLRLGSLLRRSLDEEHHEVPLREEIAFLEEYLDIQRVRFGDRLRVTLTIDPAADDANVPVLLLQPLVENAIEHAASDKGTPTTIELRATRMDATLRVTVEDNGPGPGDVSALREGIGLRNTRERLRRLYGSRATLVLRGRDGAHGVAGACVDITIPCAPLRI
jgi:sensor histidine kinase YesM